MAVRAAQCARKYEYQNSEEHYPSRTARSAYRAFTSWELGRSSTCEVVR